MARVVDGDTVVGENEMHYRLYGIDTPEKKQEYGAEAASALSYLINQYKNVVYVQSHGTEKYGRTLATLFTTPNPDQDWQNLNYMMVALGNAWVYRVKGEEARRGAPVRPSLYQYEAIQSEAQKGRQGLWVQENPESPHDFRRRTGGKRYAHK